MSLKANLNKRLVDLLEEKRAVVSCDGEKGFEEVARVEVRVLLPPEPQNFFHGLRRDPPIGPTVQYLWVIESVDFGFSQSDNSHAAGIRPVLRP